MITIEVFGPGCSRCRATLAAVEEAVRAFGGDVTVVHVSDPTIMARERVMFTPAVRVNGEMKSTGRVPAPSEVTSWLATAAAAA